MVWVESIYVLFILFGCVLYLKHLPVPALCSLQNLSLLVFKKPNLHYIINIHLKNGLKTTLYIISIITGTIYCPHDLLL